MNAGTAIQFARLDRLRRDPLAVHEHMHVGAADAEFEPVDGRTVRARTVERRLRLPRASPDRRPTLNRQ
jgi:hypothetical protein